MLFFDDEVTYGTLAICSWLGDGFCQYALSSSIRHTANDFLWEELQGICLNILGFLFRNYSFSFKRNHADSHAS